ncbi:MAG: S41 family peptidase [Candidatus Pacebacteria bacterium]|nr:S41 family peptidase [Candidatus Paceibacterota bacterium]
MNEKSFKKIFFISLLIVTSFSMGFTVNSFLDDNNNNNKVIYSNDEVDFSVFWETWGIIEDKYALGPLDYEKMVYGATSGMVDSLQDPYTVFLSPSDKEEFDHDMEGKFEGIGAEIGIRDKFLTIIAPLKDSPAEKAGLLAGDKILKIDEIDAIGIDIDEAVKLIRGEKGTKVVLLVSRDDLDDLDNLAEIEIIRDTIETSTVEWKIISNNIAYIEVSQFRGDTIQEFDNSINDIIIKEPRGMIIDLRNNPGGYVSTLNSMASRFLDKGEVIFIEDFGDEKKEHRASGGKKFTGISIVILINKGSASASEIFAGALQENGIAKLVGETTFGKGLVQEIEELQDGSAIKVTIAKWLTPNGVDINKSGINPDIEVELSFDDYMNGRDPQLDKALELFN